MSKLNLNVNSFSKSKLNLQLDLHRNLASPRPFYKKIKLSIFLDQQFEVLYILFLLSIQVES